jgi:uncharacterized protein (TIGR01777 family)
MNDAKGRVIIAGGTGFIGRALVDGLSAAGYDVVVLTRSKAARSIGRVRMQSWDGRTSDNWGGLVSGAAGIVNLAGENIASGRWTQKRRKAILQSRIWAGRAVVEAVGKAVAKPAVLIQASAVGFYGRRPVGRLEESAEQGKGFLAEVAAVWEQSSRSVEDFGVRRAVIRSGIVLGRGGGAFPRLLLPFRFFVGGPLGAGGRSFSWIHLKDEVRAIRFLLENEEAAGAFNLTAPGPVSQKEFASLLGKILGRPAWLPLPSLALKAVFGRMAAETLLADQEVFPARLLGSGFRFDFPELEPALRDLMEARGHDSDCSAWRAKDKGVDSWDQS